MKQYIKNKKIKAKASITSQREVEVSENMLNNLKMAKQASGQVVNISKKFVEQAMTQVTFFFIHISGLS